MKNDMLSPSGLATTLAIFMLMFPTFGTQDIALNLDWIFAIVFPHYNLGASIMNIYTNYQYINTCERSRYQITCQIPSMSTGSCCMGTHFKLFEHLRFCIGKYNALYKRK